MLSQISAWLQETTTTKSKHSGKTNATEKCPKQMPVLMMPRASQPPFLHLIHFKHLREDGA